MHFIAKAFTIGGLHFTPLLIAGFLGVLLFMVVYYRLSGINAVVALALNVDTAFVATHHIVRITVVVMLVPLLFKLMRKRGMID